MEVLVSQATTSVSRECAATVLILKVSIISYEGSGKELGIHAVTAFGCLLAVVLFGSEFRQHVAPELEQTVI